MFKKLFLTATALIAFILPLHSQTDFEYAITKHKGNKIVLLGAQNANEMGKWHQIIDADGVYEHGFVLRDSSGLTASVGDWLGKRNTGDFEAWFRQQYGLNSSAAWAVLDLENKLIVSGLQTPTAKEFEQMLDQRGIKTPLRQIRDFLLENPGHLDAMTDLLKEARRRALHVMPPDAADDLDDEADLRTWGVLAAETDRVFNANWLGIEPGFFRPDQIPPERFSKLMKNVFRKHISKVESAIQLEPANNALWNIWTWMARGMDDYMWDKFIVAFEPAVFTEGEPSEPSESIPSGDVCVWLLEEARAKKDWGTIIKYAKVARLGGYYLVEAWKSEWQPNGSLGNQRSIKFIEGYPAKSAYAPHLEALLRLGDIDGANDVFDEMIRLRIDNDENAHIEKGRVAAKAARDAGMEDVAKLWEKGEHVSKVPYARRSFGQNHSSFMVFSNNRSVYYEYYKKFSEVLNRFKNIVFSTGTAEFDLDTLGWTKDGGTRWALVGPDGLVMAQHSDPPDPETLHTIISNSPKLKTSLELLQQYTAKHGNYPGLQLSEAFAIFREIVFTRKAPLPDGDQDEIAWNQIAGLLNKILREHPDILVNMPQAIGNHQAIAKFLIQSAAMKSLSKPMLANIELLLERKPSSEALWDQWLTWKNIEGEGRSMEAVVERVKISPFAHAWTVPPIAAIDAYYIECRESGNWPKVIKLLKTAWDREFSRIETGSYYTNKDNLGECLGIYLIEAYLHDNKFREAEEIFNALLNAGGKLTDISKIVALAQEKGQEMLAREWEGKVKK